MALLLGRQSPLVLWCTMCIGRLLEAQATDALFCLYSIIIIIAATAVAAVAAASAAAIHARS